MSVFLSVELNSRPAICLLDTGAQTSLISLRLLQSCGIRLDSGVTCCPTAVNGSRLRTAGTANCVIRIGQTVQLTATLTVVEDISPDFILGMDGIASATQQLTIDIPNRTVSINGETLPFYSDPPHLRSRVVTTTLVARVDSNTVVPARTEKLLWLRVNSADEQGLFEPSETFTQETGLLASRVLAVSESQRIPVRVCNLGTEPVTLFSSKAVGTFEGAQVQHTEELSRANDNESWDISRELEDGQRQRLLTLLESNRDLFSQHEFDLGSASLLKHRIDLEPNSRPHRQRQRPIPLPLRDKVDGKIAKMLEHGIIEPSCSPWASNLVVVRKKTGDIRLCTDWRQLNAATVKDAYPLPHLHQAMDALSGCSWFTTIDCKQGFNQVEIEEADRHKTAFYSTRGLMQFKKMGFGMCNAPATFQRLMELVLSGLNWEEVLVYVDDLVIFSRCFDEHLESLQRVFDRLRNAGLKLNKAKSTFACRRVKYLGHIVSSEGIRPDPDKVEAVDGIPTPSSAEEVKRFVGVLCFYRRFIRDFSRTAAPLHAATQKSSSFQWTKECETAFQTLKEQISRAPVLRLPDFNEPFVLSCDASATALGAVLSQRHGDAELPVAYASRTLNKAERNYSATDRELLALVWSLKHFRTYLSNVTEFTAFTDHQPLKGLLQTKEPEGRLARWLDTIQQFNFRLLHRPGRDNVVPDALSRTAATRLLPKWTPDALLKEQTADRLLQAALKAFKDGLGGLSEANRDRVEQLLAEGDVAVDEQGVLRRQGIPVMPEHLRAQLLTVAHDAADSGHLGVNRTLEKLLERCWWPGIQQDVKNWVASCPACLRRKCPTRPQKAPLQQTPQPCRPWQSVQIDIKGPLCRTERGNQYILSMCDCFSKWMETCALSSIEAEKVADALVRQVVLRHGVPDTIHSDQGRQFESRVFANLCEQLGVEKTRTSPFHPSGNGLVERGNRTLGDMLATVISDTQGDWDEKLPFVTWAFNSSEHSTTGMSPYQLLHGWPPRLPLDVLLPNRDGDETRDVWGFVEKTRERLLKSRMQVHRQLCEAQSERNERYNQDKRFHQYDRGDLVMLSSKVVKPGLSKSLSRRWTGPFEVLKRLGEVNYRIRLAPSAKEAGRRRKFVVHHDRLKPFVARSDSLGAGEAAQSSDEDAGQEEATAADPLAGVPHAWTELAECDDVDSAAGEDNPPEQPLRRSTRERKRPDFYEAGDW
jgi:transposase InsO family protein